MADFYGRSFGLMFGQNVSGSPVEDFSNLFLHYDGASETVSAGESFTIGADVWPVADMVDAGEIVVSWVVECGPASSGSLSLRSGLDPSFDEDPAVATEPIGSATVSGASTVVLPTSSVTAADLIAGAAEPVVLIECTSGSVEVVQVKLRAWPKAGVGGAWVSGAPFETTGNQPVSRTAIGVGVQTDQYPTNAEAWTAGHHGWTDLIDQDTTYSTGTLGSIGFRADVAVQHAATVPPFQQFATFLADSCIVVAPSRERTTPGPDVTGAGVDPREIAAENVATVRAPGGGVLHSSWVRWADGTSIHIDAAGYLCAEPVTVDPSWEDFGAQTHGYAIPASRFGPLTAGDSIPLPAAPVFAAAVITQDHLTDPGGEFATGVSAGITAPTFVALVPDYEWYDPTAVAQSPRFFVKDLDGVMRPVGFGKPSTETSVFRVPGRGRWRDLTTDEYAAFGPDGRPPGGMPLKVKRQDGSGAIWWDHVGWMVPDA